MCLQTGHYHDALHMVLHYLKQTKQPVEICVDDATDSLPVKTLISPGQLLTPVKLLASRLLSSITLLTILACRDISF